MKSLAGRRRSGTSDLGDVSPWCVWTGAGWCCDRRADPGSLLCWPPSAVFPFSGRCLEEPQHERGDTLRIIRDRDVAETGEPLQLGVAHEGEEPRALHADQRVGGSLHQQDPGR